MTTTTDASSATTVVPLVKAADASEPTDHAVVVKGWVRTVRKQKTLAFVEVNDGTNLSGIQCVLTFDDIDESTREGEKNKAAVPMENSIYIFLQQ